MTPKEFAELFPGKPFAIRWVERGDRGDRKFNWHVMFTNDYWTSDTWCAVYDHCSPSLPDGHGDTIEEAIDALVAGLVERAEARRQYAKEELLEVEQEERELKARLGRG